MFLLILRAFRFLFEGCARGCSLGNCHSAVPKKASSTNPRQTEIYGGDKSISEELRCPQNKPRKLLATSPGFSSLAHYLTYILGTVE